MRRPRRAIERTRDGGFRLRLSAEERRLLGRLPGQLRDLLDGDDPALRRLFPPGYADDPALEAEYRELVRDDLIRQRRRSLEVMEGSLDAERLDQEQMEAWLAALNDLRLVLGTRLDVTEDLDLETVAPDDPRAPGLGLYAYLTWLEGEAVDALASGLR